jgi:hypothetical protein
MQERTDREQKVKLEAEALRLAAKEKAMDKIAKGKEGTSPDPKQDSPPLPAASHPLSTSPKVCVACMSALHSFFVHHF